MEIRKEASAGQGEALHEEDLALINRLSRKKLTEEEVYTFSIRLCDNEVDRDGERFEEKTLEGLAPMFVGKSGVFDHQWSARGQTARIFRTELVREEGTRTAAGDGCCYLKGYAYMLRTPGNRELIAQIEGGILREVSVGCSVKETVCSICGEPMGRCAHEKGKEYGGQLCFGRLVGAVDAYEWSFVAVPAQKKAGVMKQKGWERDGMELEKALEGRTDCLRQLETLRKEAQLGRRWLETLREDVVRLGSMADRSMEPELLKGIAEKLTAEELEAMKQAYELRQEARLPLGTQLEYGKTRADGENRDGAFLI